jgi:hypothetical protein
MPSQRRGTRSEGTKRAAATAKTTMHDGMISDGMQTTVPDRVAAQRGAMLHGISIFRPCNCNPEGSSLSGGIRSQRGMVMTAAHHHVSAAIHHERAAHYNREASRHYQIGKDYAHAAHQAVTAHGHALRALEHGHAAITFYTEHEGSPLPGYLARSSDKSASTALASPINLSGTAHHSVAAEHHDAAGRHHAQAGAHCSAEHYIRANHETKSALDHGKRAIFHGDQAAMHHMEQCGSNPSTEIA